MVDHQIAAAQHFASVVEVLSKRPLVAVGSGKRGFGSSALQVDNKIYAMLTSKEQFVVKLPVDSQATHNSAKSDA